MIGTYSTRHHPGFSSLSTTLHREKKYPIWPSKVKIRTFADYGQLVNLKTSIGSTSLHLSFSPMNREIALWIIKMKFYEETFYQWYPASRDRRIQCSRSLGLVPRTPAGRCSYLRRGCGS